MDVLTKAQRRKNMKAIKSKDTKMEVKLAKAIQAKGYRYRKHNKNVFGKPDLTFKKLKIAIFVDSEFFHGKDWAKAKFRIKSNREFWWKKIDYKIKSLNLLMFCRNSGHKIGFSKIMKYLFLNDNSTFSLKILSKLVLVKYHLATEYKYLKPKLLFKIIFAAMASK